MSAALWLCAGLAVGVLAYAGVARLSRAVPLVY